MMLLKHLLKEGESETVEFKPSLSQMDKITESIAAFSNTKGGKVIIGVSDKGEVLGVNIGKNTIESLANQIKQNTDPMAYPSIRVEESDKKQVVVIEVVEGKQKPVLAFGRAYRRVGKSNQKLGSDEIRNLAIETSKVYWDERVCEAASLDDIDEKKVRWFLKRAKYERRLELNPEAPIGEALEKLELLREGKLINAAILLFGKNPQRFIKQSETRCARFKGTKPSGCPYCIGQRATPERSLASLFPNIAKEWHPTKNGKLTPKQVSPGSHKPVWWRCKKGHEWRTSRVEYRFQIKKPHKCPKCLDI